MVFQTHQGYRLIEAGPSGREDVKGRLSPASFRLQIASQHASPLAPFASISANILRGLGSPGTDSKSRIEEHTKTSFSLDLCHKASPCAELAGLGVRAKRILGIKNINIYSIGIYVDAAAAKKALASAHKTKSEEALSQDQRLFDDVVNGSFEKSLRLVISYGHLKRAQFLDALQERLEPRLKKTGEAAVLDQFKQQFDSVAFHKGTDIVFVQDGGKLITKVDGQQKGSISSPALCKSLFDIYLGADPVAPDAKSTFGKTLASVLKQ